MANNKLKKIRMPNNQYYEVFDWYGTCNTTAGTSAKTVSISGFDSNSLIEGVRVSVKFTYKNTSSSMATLNVSSTGAKVIAGARTSNGGSLDNPDYSVRWSAGEIIDFVYDGTYWRALNAEWNPYYYYCSTANNTQAKTVNESPNRFMLKEGARATVRFQYAQTYNGIPTLNIGGTGAKQIYINSTTPAGNYEWKDGAVLDFVYDGTHWVIVDGDHATSSYYGKTFLSGYIDNVEDRAVTPQGVQNMAADISQSWMWDGEEYQSVTLVNTTTPPASDWTIDVDSARYNLSYSDISSRLNLNKREPRLVKVTFRDISTYKFIRFNATGNFYEFFGDGSSYGIYVSDTGAEIYMSASEAGEYPLKIELYDNGGAGIITYPMLKEKGYLTLDDLPIWDGTVV